MLEKLNIAIGRDLSLSSGGVYIAQLVKPEYPKGFAQFLWSPEELTKKIHQQKELGILNEDTIFVKRDQEAIQE